MKKSSLLLSIILFLFAQCLFSQENESLSGSRFSIESAILNEERHCLISLPDSYADSPQKSYPIIVLLDGYTHFKTTVSTVHLLSSDVNRNYLMPEAIVVAIENVDRERDFTVTKLQTKRANTMGGGRNFLAFIETELIPYIDNRYRTESNRTLIGHSLGGLLTLNAYMSKESLFDSFIAIDPSVWWDPQTMQQKADSIQPASWQKPLYLATANQGERGYERNQKRHENLVQLIRTVSNNKANIGIEYFEDESHRTIPLIGVYKGLRFIFSDRKE
ncbi:alpha/beta hydrolase [Roseivirga sp.]|uniref:alpha/beta hydrolase n=1 Tax=Roseivirga sp. TaxID=1964215 RepID=UPI003B51FBB4